MYTTLALLQEDRIMMYIIVTHSLTFITIPLHGLDIDFQMRNGLAMVIKADANIRMAVSATSAVVQITDWV